MRRRPWISRTVPLVTAALLAWPSGTASAHEGGVLTPDRREFAPGDRVGLAGAKFGKRGELRIVLAGLGGRIELGTVRTDAAGAFKATVRVPPDAALGAYRLIALASDGDEVAALEVAVIAAGPPAAVDHAAHGGAGGAGGEPTDEPMALDRARSPLVTGGVLATLGLALVLGVVLLRRPIPS